MPISSIRFLPSYLTMAAVLSATAAHAQVIPGAANPSQVDRRFKTEHLQLDSDVGLPIPGQPKELSPAQQASLSKVKFTLKTVDTQGNTVFTDEELKSTYDELLGKRVSLLEAQTIARKITEKYQSAGYVLSQAVVPQQEINSGTLKIIIVEGYVSHVVIQGEGLSESEREIIAAHLNRVTGDRPVTSHSLERQMLILNDLAGATVKGLLRPSNVGVGAAELLVTVTQKPYEGSLSVDNRGSKFIGPWQYNAAVTANSLFNQFDRTYLRLTTASPTKELRSIGLEHEELIGSNGTKLLFLASRTETQPGDSLKGVEINGVNDLLELKVTHPFIRSRQQNLIGRALFDYNNSDTDVFNNVDFTQDRLRVGRIGASYGFFDGWRGNNLFDVQVSQGFKIFNASGFDSNRTNANAEGDFAKFNADVSRLQLLPHSFSVFLAASGQYSMDPLMVPEQFSIGGTSFGTAYDPAEVLGDSGVAGKIELRFNQEIGQKYFDSFQLFTYYDVGQAWVRKPGVNGNDNRSLASVGGGIRTSFTENLSSSLEVGVPMTKPASNQGGHAKSPRIFFGTTARF